MLRPQICFSSTAPAAHRSQSPLDAQFRRGLDKNRPHVAGYHRAMYLHWSSEVLQDAP